MGRGGDRGPWESWILQRRNRDNAMICASHSPIVLSLAEPDQLLCFARTTDGIADIVPGDKHPRLKEWKREADLGMLFAAGVLG